MALVVGVIIGLVLGLTGAGGSVFAVPLLMVLLGLPAQQAIGLSLGAVAISASMGGLSKLKSGDIQWFTAIVYAVISGLFAPLGNMLSRQLSEGTLMIAFSLLIFLISTRMWLEASKNPAQATTVRAGQGGVSAGGGGMCKQDSKGKLPLGLPCMLGIGGGAFITGILSGLFGVGGGFLIVPTLLFLTGISIKQAVATSLIVIAVVSSSGFISYLVAGGPIDSSLLMLIAVGGVVGMGVGSKVSKHLAGPTLQKIFSGLMLIMGAVTLFNQLS